MTATSRSPSESTGGLDPLDVSTEPFRDLIAETIHCGSRAGSATVLADRLVERFPTVRSLIEADPWDFREIRGIGPAKGAVLAAALQLGHRVALPRSERIIIRGPADIYRASRRYVASLRHQRVIVIVCGVRCQARLIAPLHMTSTPTADTFPYEEVLTLVRRCGGTGFAVGQVRPGGDVHPARVHHQIAARLAREAVNARLLLRGYVLVGYGEWRSVPTDFEAVRQATWPTPKRPRREGRPYCPPPCLRRGSGYYRALVAA
jgi:DNA repair protein RadC